MATTQKSRRELLEQFVAQKPSDAFARYGLALECVKLGDDSAAAGHFHKLLESISGKGIAWFLGDELLEELAS